VTDREIINTYEQLVAAVGSGFDKRKAVSISYPAPDRSNSRDVSVSKWSVFSPFFKTDPEAAWYDYGCKIFSLRFGGDTHHERKQAALKAAMERAVQYGVTEWAKNRRGDYVAKDINDNFPIRKERK
jgi:hypothetical protein